jgi:hypothetical protein
MQSAQVVTLRSGATVPAPRLTPNRSAMWTRRRKSPLCRGYRIDLTRRWCRRLAVPCPVFCARIGLNESYERVCQGKILPPSPPREDRCGDLHQPDRRSGEVLASRCGPGRPRQSAVSTRRFHDAMVVRRLRFRKLRKQTGVALVRQPWSYLRLEAYSFIGLCEGA